MTRQLARISITAQGDSLDDKPLTLSRDEVIKLDALLGMCLNQGLDQHLLRRRQNKVCEGFFIPLKVVYFVDVHLHYKN